MAACPAVFTNVHAICDGSGSYGKFSASEELTQICAAVLKSGCGGERKI